MLLILTSILRSSKSLKINIYSPILISEGFYKLFDFRNPQIKYLSIEWGVLLTPVNKFKNNEWIFIKDLEDKELIEEISLSAYALFKFLLYTNLIYSVEEIEISGEFLTEKEKDKLYYHIDKRRNLHITALNPIKNIYQNFPNLQFNNNKDNRACNFKDHIPGMILKDSFQEYNPLIFEEKYMYIDNQKYISEIEFLFKYFNKIENINNNNNIVYTIFKYFYWKITFYFYQDSLFDVSIHLKDKRYLIDNIITIKEKSIKLKDSLNSSILSKTLKEGSQIKQLIFLNTGDVINDNVFNISVSANTLTIDWSLFRSNWIY